MLPVSVAANRGAEIIAYPVAPKDNGGGMGNPAPLAVVSTNPIIESLRSVAANVVPTLLLLVTFLAFWEIACGSEGSALPSPSRVWAESYEVIVHPLKGVSIDGSGLQDRKSTRLNSSH